MDKLPTDLKWAQFVKVLAKLGYRLSKSRAGSGRTFVSKTRTPSEFSCHEPHNNNPYPVGTLSEYLRKLNISRDFFLDLFEDEKANLTTEEERYKRYTDGAGVITSVCCKCFEKVIQSLHEHEVDAAEASHPCFQPSTAD